MADYFVLVHSPVVGPACWVPVARHLAAAGHRVTVPSLTGFASGGPPYVPRYVELARSQLSRAGADRAVIAVHSGGGVFAPYLAEAVLAGAFTASQVTVVFVDASLPPSSGPARVMDAEYLPTVRDLAVDGIVPPWPRWWPEEVMAELIPDAERRLSVLAEAPALPLEFFEEVLPPAPASWPECHAAYLRFSEGYQHLADEAAARGWPVRQLPGDHLHMLVQPAAVAAAIADLGRAAAG